MSIALKGSGVSDVRDAILGSMKPNTQAVSHSQVYGPTESLRFDADEIAPLEKFANEHSFSKLPRP
jgi:hypothetical protein